MPEEERYWKALQRLEEKMDANSALTSASVIAIVRLETELKCKVTCIDPGACLRLEPRITNLEKKSSEVDRLVNQGAGSWKTLALVGGVLLAVFQIIGWLITGK